MRVKQSSEWIVGCSREELTVVDQFPVLIGAFADNMQSTICHANQVVAQSIDERTGRTMLYRGFTYQRVKRHGTLNEQTQQVSQATTIYARGAQYLLNGLCPLWV